MYDPQTVAFEIKSPIKKRTKFFPNGHRKTLITIWHVDPENDGTDDSCGWAFPKINEDTMRQLEFYAHEEALSPWFLKEAARKPLLAHETECLLRGVIIFVSQALHIKISFEKSALLSAEILHNPLDNVRSKLCFLPGYHSNFAEDRVYDREQCATELFCIIARILLQQQRPWYKHPRWHVWHWRFQIHPWQRLRRWLFSRCTKCGKRFSYGYTPFSNQWDKARTKFMQSETDVYHYECQKERIATE